MSLKVTRTLTTTTPPERVYDYLADFTNAEEWDPGTVTCERISGDGGVGTAYRNVSSFLGRKTELTYVAREMEPGRKVHFQGHNDSFTGHDRISLTPDGAGTAVHYEAEFSFSGLAKVAVPVVALYLPRLADKTMDQLQGSLDAL